MSHLDSEPKKKRKRIRRLIVIAVVLAIVLTAGFFTVRHIWGWEIGEYFIQKAHNSWEQPDRVLRLYRVALLFDPDRSDARHNRISLFIQLGKEDRALRECDIWIKARPDDSGAYERKAWILVDQDRIEQALAVLNKFIERNPERPEGYTGKGDIYSKQEDFQKALAEYNKAVQCADEKVAGPGYEVYRERTALKRAVEGRGKAYAELGQYDEAIADYSRAIVIETEDFQKFEKHVLEIAALRPEGHLEEHLVYSKRELAYLYARRGHVYSKAEQYDEAIQDIDKAIELDPENTEYMVTRGWLYGSKQDRNIPRAIEEFSKAIEIGEQAIEDTDEELESAINRAGDKEDPWVKHYWEVRARHIQNLVKAYCYRACAYGDGKQDEFAMADLNKAVELNPEYAYAYVTRAWMLDRRGQADRALSDVNKAIELDPDSYWGHYRRGLLMYYMDDFSGALKDFAKAGEIKQPQKIYAFLWQHICRRRLGEEDAGQQLAQASKAARMNDFEKEIVGFLLDEITGDDLLKATKDEDSKKQNGNRCEAYFYIGQRYLLADNEDEARRCFVKCVATGADDYVEYWAAKKELEKLKSEQ